MKKIKRSINTSNWVQLSLLKEMLNKISSKYSSKEPDSYGDRVSQHSIGFRQHVNSEQVDVSFLKECCQLINIHNASEAKEKGLNEIVYCVA